MARLVHAQGTTGAAMFDIIAAITLHFPGSLSLMLFLGMLHQPCHWLIPTVRFFLLFARQGRDQQHTYCLPTCGSMEDGPNTDRLHLRDEGRITLHKCSKRIPTQQISHGEAVHASSESCRSSKKRHRWGVREPHKACSTS